MPQHYYLLDTLVDKEFEISTSTNSLSVAHASLNQLRGPEGASDVNSRAVFGGANNSTFLAGNFKYSTAQWISSTKGEDFMLSKAMKRIEMNILNAVHLLHLFSFKLTKTPVEALWLKFGCWSLRMSMNFPLPSCNTTIKTFLSLYCNHCPENKSAICFLHDIRVGSLNLHTRVQFDPRLGDEWRVARAHYRI